MAQQNSINVLDELQNITGYQRVGENHQGWVDGGTPAITAENLNNSDVALHMLLGKDDTVTGHFHKLVAVTADHETRLQQNTTTIANTIDTRYTKTETDNTFVKQTALNKTLETYVTSEELDTYKESVDEKVNAYLETEKFETLLKNELQGETNDFINASEILILKCGSAQETSEPPRSLSSVKF